MILKAPSPDVMNKLARGVLAMYSYDKNPEISDIESELRKALLRGPRFCGQAPLLR